MPVAAPGGGTEYVPSEVSIDEATLTQIAQLTEGKYFRATDAEALRSIDRLEKARTSPSIISATWTSIRW